MILGNYHDCNSTQKGTGVPGCAPPTGLPTGFILSPKGDSIEIATTDFDTAYINGRIKAKEFIPFLDALQFADQSEDVQLFTSQIGIKSVTRNGLPEFVFDFNKGYSGHAAAFSHNGFRNYDVYLVYDNGVILGAVNNAGTHVSGFDLGLFHTGNFKHRDGSNPEMSTVTLQLTDAEQFNQNGYLIDPDANSFDINDILPIIDANITLVSNATTDVVVSVLLAANSNTSVAGLLATDFAAIGTSETIDSITYDAVNKQYTLTFTADVSGDFAGMEVKLYDTADSTNVIESGGNHYQGSSAVKYLN